MGILSKLFGLKPDADFKQLINDGATIVDVRTAGEYASGHVKGSVNIPVDQLKHKMNTIRKDKPVITCCASGMRSASAQGILRASGFGEVYNGGSWQSLRKYKQ